jgi:hypothetical protein
VRRLFRLSKPELLLLLRALILVVQVRAALSVWPYDRVRRYFSRHRGFSKNPASSTRIVHFISIVSQRIPGASCLTRALAAETLLRWHGHDACLRIGVSKDASKRLRAHAWVESGGQIVIGGDEVQGLTPLRAAGAHPCP